MKISSVENICWVKIERPNTIGFNYGFIVEAQVDITHGQFTSKNIDVNFLNLEKFVDEFDLFITERNLEPRLEGTYDTFIAFTTSGSNVILQYRLGDAYCGNRTSLFYHSGEFEVDQENLLVYLAGFKSLLEG